MPNRLIIKRDFEDNSEIVDKMKGMVSEIRLRALLMLEPDYNSRNGGKDLQIVRFLLKEINHDIPIVETITQESLNRHTKRVLNDLEKDERSLGDPIKLKTLIVALGDTYGYPE